VTVATSTSGGVAPYEDDGLEDLGTADVAIPRLKIVGKKAVYQDSLTKDEFPELTVVILGLVKQRIMWDRNIEEGDKPQCKSPDFYNGFPNLDEKSRIDTQFPWDQSNFKPDVLTLVDHNPKSQEFEEEVKGALEHLSCAACVFKDWGKDRNGKSTPPPCSEQFSLPLLYQDPSNGEWNPSILTLQRSGVKPTRTFLAGFKQRQQATFTSQVKLSLNAQSRGSVDYAVPVFQKLGPTDPSAYENYVSIYKGARAYLTRWPINRDDDGEVQHSAPSSNQNQPSARVAATTTEDPWASPAQQRPTAPAAAAATDLPF
jgi:hypothetical protein